MYSSESPHWVDSNEYTHTIIVKEIKKSLNYGYCCCHELCTAQPLNDHSLWKLRDVDEKGKQNSARNNAKLSKCFQFLCNNSDQTWFFNALTFTRSLGRCWKSWPPVSVFNTSLGTWQILMHENPCLITILINFIVSDKSVCRQRRPWSDLSDSPLIRHWFHIKGQNSESIASHYQVSSNDSPSYHTACCVKNFSRWQFELKLSHSGKRRQFAWEK